MSKGVTDSDFFLCLIHGLWVSVVDALGHSGGTLVAWNPLLADLKVYNSCASILLAGKLKDINYPLHFINVYGSFVNRK